MMNEMKLEPCKYCGCNGTVHRREDRITVECERRDYAACVFITDTKSAKQAEREAVQRWNDRNLVPLTNEDKGHEVF